MKSPSTLTLPWLHCKPCPLPLLPVLSPYGMLYTKCTTTSFLYLYAYKLTAKAASRRGHNQPDSTRRKRGTHTLSLTSST